jgi:protein-S-isoprenylcysteine O-methyltransferase Ste14
MAAARDKAMAEFRLILKWIVVVAVLMVVGALTYLAVDGELTINMVIATILGVFFSVLLGCGLFAAAFFSSKSGHDQTVTDATRPRGAGEEPPP